MSDEVLENVNRLLKKFEGTHNYHNFTSRRQPTDPSSKRFIMSMTCGKPFVREGIEFVVIKVKGQSFMLHQIRKMIGTAMAVARGHAAEGVFERAWSLDRIDLPMAPALGLMLHEVHYDQYNQRFGSGGHNTHANIEWSGAEEQLAAFTERFVHSDIVQTELQDKSMLSWLETLPLHTFDIREGDKSPLLAAKRQVEADTAAKSAEAAADGESGERQPASAGEPESEVTAGKSAVTEAGESAAARGESVGTDSELDTPTEGEGRDPSSAEAQAS